MFIILPIAVAEASVGMRGVLLCGAPPSAAAH